MSVFKNVNVTKSIKMTSTTDTFNMASVNTTQRDAITNPEVGSLVFNNQTETVDLYKSSDVTFDVLVVAGGGAGGISFGGLRGGGGGGAGGYIYQQSIVRQSGSTYNVSVGSGAPVPPSNSEAASGGNSVFDDITAIGGGAGAGTCFGVSGGCPSLPGGSGGGGADGGSPDNIGSAGTAGQGNAGGSNSGFAGGFSPNGTAGSGGGGSGGVGAGITQNLIDDGATGGVGTSNSITGVAYTYASGGNGGDRATNLDGADGVNYGDGGAAADGGLNADNVGGGGANGVVIIRVPTTQSVNLSGLAFTSTVVSTDTVYTITSGSGTIEFAGDAAVWNRLVNQPEQPVVNTLIPIKTITSSSDWDDLTLAFSAINGDLLVTGTQTIFPNPVYDADGDYTGSTSTITNNGTRNGAYLQLTFNTPQNNLSAFRYYARSDANTRDPIEYYWAVSVSPDGPWLEIAENTVDTWGGPPYGTIPRFIENTVPVVSGVSYCCVRLIVVRMRDSGNLILENIEVQVYRQGQPYADLDFEGNTKMNALSVNTIRPNAVSAGNVIINTDIVPDMTESNIPAPFEASTDATRTNYEAWRAFDNDVNTTYWSSATNAYAGIYLGDETTTLTNISSSIKGAYVEIDLGQVRDIRGYSLVYPSGIPNNRLPQTWIVSSSLDGSTWNYVDYREFSAWVDNTPQIFTIDNPVEGQHYRISINKTTNGAPGVVTEVRVYNWELFEATTEFKPEVSIEGNLLITGGTLLNTLNMNQVSTLPQNPSSGSNKLYFKSDGNLYKLDSAGTETLIG